MSNNLLAYDPITYAEIGKRRDQICDACHSPAVVLVVFERFGKHGKTQLCRHCAPPPVGERMDSNEFP